MKKIAIISLTILSILSKVSGQTQADCNNLYLDTDTFYLSYQEDTVVMGHLFYLDTVLTFYPVLHLILSDTSIITSPDIMVLSALGIAIDTTEQFHFTINFKTETFPNNTIVNGFFHIYDSDMPGDTIVSCYLPITIILQGPDDPDGISETVENEKIKIYPNPAVGELNIENNSTQLLQFTLYNSVGEKIIDKTLTDKTSVIDLSSYSADIYFYKLASDKSIVKTGKLMKQ